LNNHVVLYVEDDPLSREAMSLVLTRLMGLTRVHLFEDSTNFMERLKALPEKPDVILLDVRLAPLDGYELVAMLRNDPEYRQARIIALTGSILAEDVDAIRRRGFDAAIGKPINVMQLPALLKRVINGESIWLDAD